MSELKTIEQLLTDAFDAGRAAADPTQRITAYRDPRTSIEVPVRVVERDHEIRVEVADDIHAAVDALRERPHRAKGTLHFAELTSFVLAVNRQKDEDSVIWADVVQFTMTAVINEIPPRTRDGFAPSAWRDHRMTYSCPRSPAWQAWTLHDGKELHQEAFADHVEAHLEHLTSSKGYPAPTEVLQMARDLTVLTKGTFQRQINPTTGASILVCKTETETGSTQIPRAFLLAIPVFDGGTPYQVEARVRFALRDGSPRFSYTLHRRAEIERDAFNDIREEAIAGTGLPVWAGRPG